LWVSLILGNTNVLLKADFRLLCVTDTGQERLFLMEKPLPVLARIPRESTLG